MCYSLSVGICGEGDPSLRLKNASAQDDARFQSGRLQISSTQRIAGDEPEKVAIKANGLFFQEKEKRLSESK
jgi:hypothetical protein